MTILLVVDDNDERMTLYNALKINSRVNIITSFSKEAREYLNTKVDVMIIDLCSKYEDPISLIKAFSEIKKDLKIIAIADNIEDGSFADLSDLGVDYMVSKPYTIAEMKIKVFNFDKDGKITNNKFNNPIDAEVIEKKVLALLSKTGINPYLKGYKFLAKSITYAYIDPKLMSSVTKILYPKVAKSFKSSAVNVERIIRHAIETTWNKSDNDGFDCIGITKDNNANRPTNSKFINAAIEQLKDDDKNKIN